VIAADRRALTVLLMIAGIAGIVVVVYADSFASMASLWNDGYDHGIAVFPISAYLLWRLRRDIAAVELSPWPLGIVAVGGLVLSWLASRAVGVQALEHLAVVLLIPAAVAACLGVALVRCALFPLLFLVAAVPVGDALIPHLMRFTADVSTALLRSVGVPVLREGQFITLPGGEFEVADVCSGLRYLIAGTMVALLFAYLTYRSARRRALFVAIAAASLIVVNGIRAFVVMWVASATELRLMGGQDHVYFGWVLFALVVGVLFWLGARYSEEPAPLAAGGDGSVTAAAAPRMLPAVLALAVLMLALTALPWVQGGNELWLLALPAGVLLFSMASRFYSRPAAAARGGAFFAPLQASSAAVVGAVVAVLVAGPLLASRLIAGAPGGATVSAALPSIACGEPRKFEGEWRPELRMPQRRAEGSYSCGGHDVNVVVAGYVGNAQGSELISTENRITPDSWRRFAAASRARFETRDGRSVEVNEVRADSVGVQSVVWYWYTVGQRTATRPITVKALQAVALLRSGSSEGAIYWLETSLMDGASAGRDRLATVAAELEAARSLHLQPDGG
jgi:exosortase A